MHTQDNNRAHALASSQALPRLVLRERQRHQRYLENRMKQLRREARRLIARDTELDRRYQLMLTIPASAKPGRYRFWRNWLCSPTRPMLASGLPSVDSILPCSLLAIP
jgi:hypothetical protein